MSEYTSQSPENAKPIDPMAPVAGYGEFAPVMTNPMPMIIGKPDDFRRDILRYENGYILAYPMSAKPKAPLDGELPPLAEAVRRQARIVLPSQRVALTEEVWTHYLPWKDGPLAFENFGQLTRPQRLVLAIARANGYSPTTLGEAYNSLVPDATQMPQYTPDPSQINTGILLHFGIQLANSYGSHQLTPREFGNLPTTLASHAIDKSLYPMDRNFGPAMARALSEEGMKLAADNGIDQADLITNSINLLDARAIAKIAEKRRGRKEVEVDWLPYSPDCVDKFTGKRIYPAPDAFAHLIEEYVNFILWTPNIIPNGKMLPPMKKPFTDLQQWMTNCLNHYHVSNIDPDLYNELCALYNKVLGTLPSIIFGNKFVHATNKLDPEDVLGRPAKIPKAPGFWETVGAGKLRRGAWQNDTLRVG